MRFRITENFTKELKKLDPISQKAVAKALNLLLEDPAHPSLRTKKMEGWQGKYNKFEDSPNKDIRITFHY